MSENARISAPVMSGNVVATMISELTALCRELDQHRLLAADLAAWFDKHPDLDERFGSFQRARQAARAAARRPTVPAPAKTAKRSARR